MVPRARRRRPRGFLAAWRRCFRGYRRHLLPSIPRDGSPCFSADGFYDWCVEANRVRRDVAAFVGRSPARRRFSRTPSRRFERRTTPRNVEGRRTKTRRKRGTPSGAETARRAPLPRWCSARGTDDYRRTGTSGIGTRDIETRARIRTRIGTRRPRIRFSRRITTRRRWGGGTRRWARGGFARARWFALFGSVLMSAAVAEMTTANPSPFGSERRRRRTTASASASAPTSASASVSPPRWRPRDPPRTPPRWARGSARRRRSPRRTRSRVSPRWNLPRRRRRAAATIPAGRIRASHPRGLGERPRVAHRAVDIRGRGEREEDGGTGRVVPVAAVVDSHRSSERVFVVGARSRNRASLVAEGAIRQRRQRRERRGFEPARGTKLAPRFAVWDGDGRGDAPIRGGTRPSPSSFPRVVAQGRGVDVAVEFGGVVVSFAAQERGDETQTRGDATKTTRRSILRLERRVRRGDERARGTIHVRLGVRRLVSRRRRRGPAEGARSMKKRQPLLVSEGNLRTAARGRRPHRRCIDGPNRRQKSRFVPTRRGTTSRPSETVRDVFDGEETTRGESRRVRGGEFGRGRFRRGAYQGAYRERARRSRFLPRVRNRASRARATHARTVVVGVRGRGDARASGDGGGGDSRASLALLPRTRRPGGGDGDGGDARRRRFRRRALRPGRRGRRDSDRSRGVGEPRRGGTSPGFGVRIVPARNRTPRRRRRSTRRARRKPPR